MKSQSEYKKSTKSLKRKGGLLAEMKSLSIGILLLLTIFLLGCSKNPAGTEAGCPTEFSKSPLTSGLRQTFEEWALFEQCGKNIPAEYKNITYCEADSDCAVQDVWCSDHIAVNKFNVVDNYTDKVYAADMKRLGYSSGGCSMTETIPRVFLISYCNDNGCDLKINCSDCFEINQSMKRGGCFESHVSTSQHICDALAGCVGQGCTTEDINVSKYRS